MVSDTSASGRKRGVKIGGVYAAFTRSAPGFTTFFGTKAYRGCLFHDHRPSCY
jgi:hypothetical protein